MPPRPTRPGVFSTIWTNFKNSLTRQSNEKIYVGEDSFGNKFYEYKKVARRATTNVMRGYDPSPDPNAPKPSVEWHSWTTGSRRFPPSEQEIQMNRLRAQSQLSEDAETEKRAPKIESTGKGAADVDRPHAFPTYKDIEIAPGVKKTESND
uniref:NADH dehydrogenase [ubiquinone] 1 alpha subcomplex subunit 12 n=1 Tax=Acrobeloides nanus TaxID=290746 RepID=A0A914CBJ8_9BILA